MFFNQDIKHGKLKNFQSKSHSTTNKSLSSNLESTPRVVTGLNREKSLALTKSMAKEKPLTAKNIDNLIYLEGKSLWLFKMDNKLRRILFDIVTAKYFDYFIVLVIFVSAVQLAMDNPLNNPNGDV